MTNPVKSLNIPSVHLLGVRVHGFTIPMLHQTVEQIINAQDKAVIANVNVHAMNISWEQSWFRDFLNQADYVFCDGHGVMLGARLCGIDIPKKITYAHWFPLFCSFCAERHYSMFFLGGEPGVAELARERLCKRNPSLRVRGCQNGFFNKTKDSAENIAVVNEINRCKPDVLLLSLGMPLQEKWLLENWRDLNVHVALTGGACLDYMAGRSKRPPPWMTNCGFEWFGRLLYEPRRLWKRYVIGNPLFFLRLCAWYFGKNKK